MVKPITVYCDGLCEPVNPGGTACFGWVIYEGKKKIAKDFGVVCSGPGATNNIAEYTALIKALEWLLENGCTDKEITVCSDSQLCIYQLQGIYAVRSPKIIPLYNRAVELAEKFSSLSFKWVPREQNEEADKLSRKAYKKHMSTLENTREYKAKQIAPNVVPLSGKKFRVPSQTRPGIFYLVDLDRYTCTCPDFQVRGRKVGYCKHLLAVEMYLSGGRGRGSVAL
ncbi:MAG: ribonuclease HI [Thermacetogeniaceae bacterium]